MDQGEVPRSSGRGFSHQSQWTRVVCLLVIIGRAWTLAAQIPTPVWVGEKIWADEGADVNDVSADGRTVTLVNFAAAGLWTRDLTSGTNRPLVRTRANFNNVVISPDGTRVAYNWSTGASPALSIAAVAEGSSRTIETGRSYPSWVHDWTTDGQQLLVVADRPDAESEIGFLEIQTSGFRRVGTVYPGGAVRLSPDGSRILVSELVPPDHTQRDLRIIDVESGRSQWLLTGPADDYSADWSPDGHTIYFLSDRENKARLWKVSVSASAPKPEPLHEIPDGANRILRVTRDGGVFVTAYDIGGTNSYVGDVDWRTGELRAVRQLTNPPLRGSRRAVFSPDGEQVAFLRRPRGFGVRPGWQIPVVQSFDGSRERVYPTALTLRDEPAWSADGSALFFAVPPEGAVGNTGGTRWRFMRLDLNRGTFTEVGTAAGAGQVRIAGLMRDDLFYLLHDFKTRTGAVMALNLTTGAARTLYRHHAAMADAAVAPDRQRIAFTASEGGGTVGVYVVSVSATDPQRMTALQGGGAQLMWFSDGSSLITNGGIDGKSGMWRLSLRGDAPVRLKLDFEDVTEVRATRDGRRVAFTRPFQRQREVWAYRVKQ